MNFCKYVLFGLLLNVLLLSCESSILDKEPLDRFSDATVWKDINLVDRYVQNLYHELAIGWQTENLLNNITDDVFNRTLRGTDVYLKGDITPDNLGPISNNFGYKHLRWNRLFSNIQKINILLDNIDKVLVEADDIVKSKLEKDVNLLKGEAYFLRAFCYSNLARIYGGVPLFHTANKQTDDLLSVKRASFAKTINFISDDCDQAAMLLGGKDDMIMGRATKGAALALKSRILLFAASDLCAGEEVINEYVGYVNPDRNKLWANAKSAAKAVMDLNRYRLEDFGAPDRTLVSQKYYEFFKQKDLSSDEIIWGKMYDIPNEVHKINILGGPNGVLNWGVHDVTQNLVDYYQMEDGSSFFDHFDIIDDYYINNSDKYTEMNIYKNRDPRFTGAILYDSAVWQPRFDDLKGRDPLGIYERRTKIYVENGTVVSRIPGIDTGEGPVYASEASHTGYLMRKFLDDGVVGAYESCDHIWIEFRYAEIILNYAEACLALGESAEAEKYINQIRNRAGMPNLKGDLINALLYERRIEFALSEIRFYDIRRWRILDQTIGTPAYGIIIEETIDDSGSNTTWKRNLVQNRGPINETMYWFPIPQDEINRAPQLIQNPGF